MRFWIISAFALLATTTSAYAQRTDSNAVTQVDDAFGASVGDEQIGIYNAYDVRGFSPVDAGNVRIEGLYFDQQSDPTDRLVDGNTIHVGISAQGYAFPAPTGIADYSLRKAGKDAVASVGLNYGPYGGKSAEVDFQFPLDGDRLGIAAGAGIYRETESSYTTSETESYGFGVHWSPTPGVSIQPFWSQINVRDQESNSLIFTSTGDFLPKRVPRDQFLGQPWADFAAKLGNYGIVAKANALGLEVALGAFRSWINVQQDHTDLLFDTDPSGKVADRVVIAQGNDSFSSTSGELRISKSLDDGPRRHTVIASLRARQQDRRYGGAVSLDLGPSQIGVQDFKPEQVAVIGAKTFDTVAQKTFGIGYQLRWKNLGEINLGVQKTDYRKRITDPNPAIIFPQSRAKPWLFSATAAAYVSPSIALYGGYTRGLEESPVAPSNAVNLNEAPPAIQTEQKEAGVRWRIAKGITMVVGVFDVSKPYFNLDGNDRFRQLGQVRNRGVEFSLSGQIAPGLNVVAGNVFIDSVVSGEEVKLGLIGKRPVGAFVRHSSVNLDYKMKGFERLSFSAAMEATSDRTANAANTLVIPARAVFSLGARYKFKVGGAPALVRFNVGNIFNTFGWNVGGNGFFTPNGARRFSLSLAADF
jgi:iron complex outermembrane recepter protein